VRDISSPSDALDTSRGQTMPSQAISSQFLSIAEYEKCGRAFTYSVHLDEPCLLVGSDMKIISHEKRVQKTTSDGQDRQKSPWSSE
jgi:hypothetical protein